MGETKTRVATPAVMPVLSFRDGLRTIEWLTEAFGFEQAMVVAGDDGFVHHCELAVGRQLLMGGSAGGEQSAWKKIAHPPGRAMFYVALDAGQEDHCERARAAGAEIVIEIEQKEYGGADYSARDPEGNLWTFGTYVPELPS